LHWVQKLGLDAQPIQPMPYVVPTRPTGSTVERRRTEIEEEARQDAKRMKKDEPVQTSRGKSMISLLAELKTNRSMDRRPSRERRFLYCCVIKVLFV